MTEPARPSRLLALGHSGIWLSVVCWGVALATPALYLANTKSNEVQDWGGAACAFLGPFALFSGCPAWLANLTLFVSIILFLGRRYGLAAIIAGASLLLGLTTFLMFSIAVPLDEAGANQGRVLRLGIGFYFWMIALALPGISSLVSRRGASLTPR